MNITSAGPVTVDPSVAREAGFRPGLPVVLTRAAWDAAVTWAERDDYETGTVGQSDDGRLWDVLTQAVAALRRPPSVLPCGVHPLCEDFAVLRIPRGRPYAGDDDKVGREYQDAMFLPLVVVVGGTPTTATISLDDE